MLSSIKRVRIGVIALILALLTLSFWIILILGDPRRLPGFIETLSYFTAIAAAILGTYAWLKSKDKFGRKFGLLGLGLVVLSILGFLTFLFLVIGRMHSAFGSVGLILFLGTITFFLWFVWALSHH